MEINDVLKSLQDIYFDTSVAKNLVNGKPIDADRKLQGVLTKINNLYKGIYDQLDSKNIEKST
jgi:hypothetical protein